MPRRDGAPGLQQTRISLKLDDTPINRRAAAKQLQTLEGQLSTGTLEWAYWLDETAGSITWREAIAKFYRVRVVLGRTGESTWQVNDLGRLRQVPQGGACTTKSIRPFKVVRSTTSEPLADAGTSLQPGVVSASEANRSFSSLLRQVAQGQRFTVLSHGRPVATIAPAAESSASLGVSRRALLVRLATQPASGEPRSWQRDNLYD